MRVLLTILAFACATAVDAHAQRRPQPTFAALTIPPSPLMRAWVDAVARHVPGEFDSATLVPANWNRDEIRHFWIYVQLITALLRRETISAGAVRVLAGTPIDIRLSQNELDDLRAIAREAEQLAQVDTFFKRAALLHTDIVRFISGESAYAASDVSMLMPQRVMVETEDGQQRSLRRGAVHWEIARVLLGRVAAVERDPFVRDWYRATMKHKLGREDLDALHFEQALRLFPENADIRFLAGCLHESLAGPQVQAARRGMKLPGNVKLAFGDTGTELAQAQSHFQRAIELDPGHAEARLRLGRTLQRRGRTREAIAELQQAIDATADPVVKYFGHLFLGSALESAARVDEAKRAFNAALAVYPEAQAPRIGLSQLAHTRGDRVEAERVLRGVLVPAAEKSRDADPWWWYSRSSGRGGAAALDALGNDVRPSAPRP